MAAHSDAPGALVPTDFTGIGAAAPLRVIARPAGRNRRLNPYNALLYDALRARGVVVNEYLGARWLATHHQLFHVHWPESVFNHGLAGALTTTGGLLRAMDWLRWRGTRCVWTVHNLRAHERRYPRQEQAFWNAFTRRLDAFFVLDQSAIEPARQAFPVLRERPAFVVPHPHYRDAYPASVTRPAARATLGLCDSDQVLAFVGQIQEYKNVLELVRVFGQMQSGDHRRLRLLIAGKPRTPRLAAELAAAAAADPRVVLRLQHLPSAELSSYLRAADLVVLPYREILNSGSAVLALSFDRCVLMPEGLAASSLRGHVGAAWVRGYLELTSRALQEALTHAAGLPARCDGPWLEACSPDSVAAATLAAYQRILAAPLAPPSHASIALHAP